MGAGRPAAAQRAAVRPEPVEPTGRADEPGSTERATSSAPKPAVPVWAIAAGAIAVLALHAGHHLPFLADDALISLRYSQRLLAGDGLTWTDGPRVEGYSNPTWVLATALLGWLGIDLIAAARILGFVGFATAISAVAWWFRPARRGDALAATASSLALALTGSFAVWSVGGLEQPLLVGLLALATVRLLGLLDQPRPATGSVLVTGTLYGLVALSRPDGVLFVGAAAVSVVLVRRFRSDGWRLALLLVAVPVALLLAQLAFRLAYYDDWLPNTAYAKLAATSTRIRSGARYTATGLVPLVGLWLPALAAAVALRRTPAVRRRILALVLSLAVWTAYVVVVGGDTFPGRRHLAVTALLLAFLAGEWWRWMQHHPQGRVRRAAWPLALASLVVLGLGQLVLDNDIRRAERERWEWDCKVIADSLREGFEDEQPLFAVTAAGCLPYFSELPALDLLGLTDRYLAHHRPADIGSGALGHELGDGRYALGRRPDLVSFCGPFGSAHGCYDADRSMEDLAGFRTGYRLVPFVAEGADGTTHASLIWVRTASPRIGIRPVADGLVVPGLVFGRAVAEDEPPPCVVEGRCVADGSTVVAVRGDDVVAVVPTGGQATTTVDLPAGRWTIDLGASGPAAATVRDAATGRLLSGGTRLDLDEPTRVEVAVEAGGRPVELRSVTFRATP